MAIEVSVDGDLCMGSGSCVFSAERVFELGDEGVAVVIDPAAAPLDDVIDAARNCPTGAISVHRDGTKLV